METKFIKIPFEVELAKKISNGEVEGQIIDNYNNHYRLICFDLLNDKGRIIGLRQDDNYKETALVFSDNGYCVQHQNLNLFLKLPEEKPKCEFKPFDRVLVRDLDFNIWYNDIFSFRDKDGRYMCIGNKWDECIPYNEETAHLLGTTENYE